MKHLLIDDNEGELYASCYDADLADSEAICVECSEEFVVQGVIVTPIRRYYIAIADDHIHCEIGGDTQS